MHHEHLILCALSVEASWVRRFLRRESLQARVLQIGPGPENAKHAFESIHSTNRIDITLFGVAGGLSAPAGIAVVPGRIVNETGTQWEIESGDQGVTLLGTDRIVRTTEEKRSLLQATGAHAVDMESHAFAESATSRGIPFRIVRGISDGPEDTLPVGIDRWTNAHGRVNPVPLLSDIAQRRVSIRELRRLQKNTAMALNAAGSRLATMLQ